jgi:hypothetical protein
MKNLPHHETAAAALIALEAAELYGAQPGALRVHRIRDDNNLPEMRHGDAVIVNTSDRKPSPPGWFLVFDGAGHIVRRCEHIHGSNPPLVRFTAANKLYNAFELPLDECQIDGRVIGKLQRM